MGIATSGLGGTHLITMGYGFKKWVKIPKAESHTLGFCPYCEEMLKNTLYYTIDRFSGRKIYKCSNCYGILKCEDGRWRRVVPWYERD
jgi:hypothetical protein